MKIDINADIGEGCFNDKDLFSLISSCNIACGGHFGDKNSIQKSIKLAINNDVKIGAHPSFPDKLNFGRKIIKISSNNLEKSLTSQINLVIKIAKDHHKRIHHVKPHGALYVMASTDEEIARAIADAVTPFNVAIFGMANTVHEKVYKHERGLNFIAEFYADLDYDIIF